MAFDAFIADLIGAIGAEQVILGDALGTRRVFDWSGVGGVAPLALIRPRNTAEVATVMQICTRHRQPVVPQGGLTGLAAGANPRGGEVALSLERMNAIEEVDVVSGTMTVQAGVLLQKVQECAAEAGMMFPLDLGARGSCMIGGTLATNAGGNRVIKYGMMRDQVLGIEAVLADGTVIDDLHKMIKNNSGYDLKNVLIGSEGTLAVLTRVVLRLRAKPMAVSTAWCGLPDFQAVTTLMRTAQERLSGGVSAFEVMWPSYVDYVLENVKTVRAPLDTRHAFYVLLESVGSDAARQDEEFEAMLTAMLEAGIVENASIAQSQSDARRFWDVRDAPAEFPILMPDLVGFDVSFSIADIGEVAERCDALLRAQWPDCVALIYGHLGDGNLHMIVSTNDPTPGVTEAIEATIYGLVRDYRGAVSAEHGIGSKKRQYLGHTRGAGELAAMRAIKQALDPLDLLNPGKILSAPQALAQQ